jgi:predicted helicase
MHLSALNQLSNAGWNSTKANAMATDHRAELARIHRFDQLIRYLRDEMGWPIASDDFEELTFDYTAEELGINAESAAKIQEIKRLRPLSAQQPWGIFFVKFEPKNLPVVALRRILSQVALKKRASANAADRAGWAADDLLFVSNYGQDGERKISFAHFARPSGREDLPTLKVLGWDNQDTPLHLDAIARELTENLAWPQDENDADAWRQRWRSAFTLGHREVIATAERLSIRLAELAGAIRDRIRSAIAIESPRGPLTRLMKAFQESLVHDLDAEGFADMYAQTISYGLLSSRITDPSKKTADDFASHMRTSPFLRELMQTFLKAGGRKDKSGGAGIDFDELGVADVVELLDGANMEAVLRDFGDRNRQEDPVIHFFEGFLQAYDKRIRKDRGVFYTPQPVVSYIVRSVHELLQTEFGLKDGLADTTTWGEILRRHPGLKLPPLTNSPEETRTISPEEPFVQILDPATGTATFLVEVIDVIYRTLVAKWKLQLLTDAQQRAEWNDYVPQHLLPRLHAFELMMAPYAIAHMKVGLKLAETGYQFGVDERARIYLTNALEPWVEQLPLIGFDALAHEAAAVNEIKRNKRFTVVIGNPPYSIQSQNLTEAARAWANPYRYLDGELIRERGALQFEKALQDDCVKFASFSQRRIVESFGGLLGLIMSHSYIDNPTLRGMRQNLGQTFESIYVLDLHGNSTKKERCPDGSEDENVFDIKQGVAILIGMLRGPTPQFAKVHYGEIWGSRETKYARLEKSSIKSIEFQPANPISPSYLFKPQSADARDEFNRGFKVTEVFVKGSVGIITARDNLVIDFEADPLVERAIFFRDSKQSDQSLCETLKISLKKGWDISRAREKIKLDRNLEEFVKPLCYRPFDSRLIFYHQSLVWGMSYPTMRNMLPGGNLAMMVGRAGQVIGQDEWDIIFCTRGLTEFNLYRRGGHNLLPLYLAPEVSSLQAELISHANSQPNLSPSFLRALATALVLPQNGQHGLPNGLTPEDIFYYIYAVFHSPGYRSRYAEFLKIDFPRVPLTGKLELFHALARLGGELTALHLLESPRLDKPITEFIGERCPEVEKVSWSRETVWVDKTQTTGFRGVGEEVWKFHIGGYQVCEKWLKDRKGRTLSKNDIAHYQKAVVALSETIRLMAKIDEVIDQHGGWPDTFSIK